MLHRFDTGGIAESGSKGRPRRTAAGESRADLLCPHACPTQSEYGRQGGRRGAQGVSVLAQRRSWLASGPGAALAAGSISRRPEIIVWFVASFTSHALSLSAGRRRGAARGPGRNGLGACLRSHGWLADPASREQSTAITHTRFLPSDYRTSHPRAAALLCACTRERVIFEHIPLFRGYPRG